MPDSLSGKINLRRLILLFAVATALITLINSFYAAYRVQRTVLVEGFTDSTGADAYNQTLSTERADAVRVALLAQGIASNRVVSRGYGKANPVGSNDTAAGRQMNRRVEIVLSDDSGRTVAR